MEKLINRNSCIKDSHEGAIKENIKRTEALKPRDQTIRIEVSVNQLLVATRKDRKLFFLKLVKYLKSRLEIIRIERRAEQ